MDQTLSSTGWMVSLYALERETSADDLIRIGDGFVGGLYTPWSVRRQPTSITVIVTASENGLYTPWSVRRQPTGALLVLSLYALERETSV